MKIYLVGMPGSGKSTLGHQLAVSLSIPFIDLDKEIEKKAGKPVSEIFAEMGEDYFRQIESEELHFWAKAEGQFVLATGGGAPCFFNGMEIINKTGRSIFLDVPEAELVKRLKEKTDRPLLQNADLAERLIALRNKRIAIYKQAHIIVSDAYVTVDHLLKKLTLVKK